MIEIEDRGAVRVLALSRPPVNALNLPLAEAMSRALVDEAVREAQQLLAIPAYARVKEQLRGATSAKLRHIVEHDEEPLHRGWIQPVRSAQESNS